jgi:hypothetical protein
MGEEMIIRKPAPETSPTLRDLLAVLFRQGVWSCCLSLRSSSLSWAMVFSRLLPGA